MEPENWIKVSIVNSSNNVFEGDLNLLNVCYYEKSATNSNNTRVFTNGGHKLIITLTVAQLREKIYGKGEID